MDILTNISDQALLMILIGGLIAFVVAEVSIFLKRRADIEIVKRAHIEQDLRIRTGELEITKAKIEHERAQLGAILSSMGEGVLVFGKNKKIILMNQAAGILLRIAPADAIGQNVGKIFKIFKGDRDISETDQLTKKVLRQANKISIKLVDNFYSKDKSGTVFPVTLSAISMLRGGKIDGAIIVFRNVKEEKLIDRAKNEFVSLASHQLNTPLATTSFYVDMLLAGDAGKINKEQKQYLKEIHSSNERALELVRALLNVSRIELGTFVVESEPTNLTELVNNALSELSPQIKNKKLEVQKNYDKKMPAINADPKFMQMVFQNLLSNAVKYTPQKGKISIDIKKQSQIVSIKISDDGYGIPKHQQSKVFNKLFRADNAKEKEPDGTGLGLYIAKAIVEQSGGKIWFESPSSFAKASEDKENPGTTFYITIPI